MNPKKKSRRCRASASIQALDLAISCFIYSFVLTVLRETFTQYIRGERRVFTLLLCSLATVLFCIDPPVRIVTKSSKEGPLYFILHLSGRPYLKSF
jgi:hypothetical protein